MIHTGIVQYLSEIDTNIFLSFNGIHSPFWDYFMSSFTGKFIWIPMYATILYILLKNFHWKVSTVLRGCHCTDYHLCRPNVQQHHSSGSSTSASRQSGEPDCRSGIYRKWLPRGKLRFPIVPCSQFIRSCHVCHIPVP